MFRFDTDSPRAAEHGFTLPELLVAIVVAGVLSAVAVVGVAGLTNRGGVSACAASADAARTASGMYYSNMGTFPTRWSDMTTASPPVYELANGVTINRRRRRELDGQGWELTMTGGGTTNPTFTCS
jgi:prepilin-type N-terminal cleavage/methylation domain-containing protein